MFTKIRQNIGLYFLNRQVKVLERDRAVFNLKDAQTIGIVYDATDSKEFEAVKKFCKYLKERNKRIMSLGFVNVKEEDNRFKTQLEYRFFTKKELNWHFKPTGLEVENFTEEVFDILIDFSFEESFSIKYISGLSKAKFKVGAASDNSSNYYDMVIDIGNNKTLENLIGNINHYLDMINQKNIESIHTDNA
ncbi:MAG: hypothetical protein COB85_06955 [Bacteroidetes bacterium]|nr:MAG: hypothetical protein COB85_06955 [Bacteroidota bacterium]